MKYSNPQCRFCVAASLQKMEMWMSYALFLRNFPKTQPNTFGIRSLGDPQGFEIELYTNNRLHKVNLWRRNHWRVLLYKPAGRQTYLFLLHYFMWITTQAKQPKVMKWFLKKRLNHVVFQVKSISCVNQCEQKALNQFSAAYSWIQGPLFAVCLLMPS